MSKPTNAEEKKEQSNGPTNHSSHLPESIINYYAKYRNNSPKLRVLNVMGSKFEIDSKYEILDTIGHGAYGIVIAARDHEADEEHSLVAIKKIERAFEHKIFTKRTLRELKILRLLQHENVIGIKTMILPRSREHFEDIYVVSELMETDLAAIIKSNQALTDDHCQFFLYQILRGIRYIHSANILHRDLKPRNILVNSNCDIKICDFGLARAVVNSCKMKSGIMTDYVATRWYRAPELLLSWKDYSTAVDIWSVGCIFAELLKRKPFLSGTDTRNQIELIFEVLGSPTPEEIELIPTEKSKKLVKSLPKRKGKNLETLFPNANPDALDLLKKMLTFNPAKRITVEQALLHPYLADLHSEDDEPTREEVSKLEFEFENYNFTIEQLKDMIYEEILLYHFPEFCEEFERRKASENSLIKHILENDNARSDASDEDMMNGDIDDDLGDDDFGEEDPEEKFKNKTEEPQKPAEKKEEAAKEKEQKEANPNSN